MKSIPYKLYYFQEDPHNPYILYFINENLTYTSFYNLATLILNTCREQTLELDRNSRVIFRELTKEEYSNNIGVIKQFKDYERIKHFYTDLDTIGKQINYLTETLNTLIN